MNKANNNGSTPAYIAAQKVNTALRWDYNVEDDDMHTWMYMHTHRFDMNT